MLVFSEEVVEKRLSFSAGSRRVGCQVPAPSEFGRRRDRTKCLTEHDSTQRLTVGAHADPLERDKSAEARHDIRSSLVAEQR